MYNLIKELSETFGPSGYEDEIRKVILKNIKEYAEKVKVDVLGNIIAKVGAGKKKIMIEAHMDEIALMVKHIDEKGFIYVVSLGGWDPRILLGQRVVLRNYKGEKIIGVVGSKPVHLMEKDESKEIKLKDLFIDIGAKDKKEVEKWDIKPGDVVVIDATLKRLGKTDDLITGKALDNRIGCAVVIEVMKSLPEDLKNEYTFYFVFTVQEEVGLKGARTSGFELDVDFAISVDTAPAGDTPGIEEKVSELKVGKGVVIEIVQAEGYGLITPRSLVDKAVSIMEKVKIPYQVEVGVGGVSNAAILYITKKGIPTLGIGIATRNLHTPIEVASLKDIEYAVKSIIELLKNKIIDDHERDN
ncbi:MAG: M42 family metallopeptidase [Candidatus Nanohaloarchaeota archaeon]|nr:M42 family metallopeptidase [Candidatus Nanohaloarchaeota archaeon]